MPITQFDVVTGEALSGPVPADLGHEPPPPRLAAFLRNAGALMQHIRTESLGVYPVRIEAGWVLVAL